MCDDNDHDFGMLTYRKKSHVQICRKCGTLLVIPTGFIDWMIEQHHSPDDNAAAPAPLPTADAERLPDQVTAIADHRANVLAKADRVAAEIGRVLRGQIEPRGDAARSLALLEQLIDAANTILTCGPLAGLVAEQDLDLLLSARAAALDRLRSREVGGRSPLEVSKLIAETRAMLATNPSPAVLTITAKLLARTFARIAATANEAERAALQQVADEIESRLSAAVE